MDNCASFKHLLYLCQERDLVKLLLSTVFGRPKFAFKFLPGLMTDYFWVLMLPIIKWKQYSIQFLKITFYFKSLYHVYKKNQTTVSNNYNLPRITPTTKNAHALFYSRSSEFALSLSLTTAHSIVAVITWPIYCSLIAKNYITKVFEFFWTI